MAAGDGKELAARLSRALTGLPEVRLAYLFGSRARGRARQESDFDVAVLVDDAAVEDAAGRSRTMRHLAGALGREVSSALLDVVLLNHAPVLLRHRVLRDGILLRERAPVERVRFVLGTLREYQDTAVRRNRLTEYRIRRLKGPIDGGSGDLLAKARGIAPLLAKAEGPS